MEISLEIAKKGRQTALLTLIINLVLGLLQLAGSIWGSSQALLADAVHTFSDCLTDLVVVISLKFSHQPADRMHPYGHGKIETLATAFIGTIMTIAGGHIALDFIQKLFSHQTLSPNFVALGPAILCIIIKEFLFRTQYKKGKKYNLPSLKANAWHNRSDSFSSIAVLLGISGSLLGIKNLDVVAGIIVAITITAFGVYIIYKASCELVETSISEEKLSIIKKQILTIKNIKDINNLRARKVGTHLILDIVILVDGELTVNEAHKITDKVEDLLSTNPNINANDISIHVEPFLS